MHRLELLPLEIQKDILRRANYEEIINTCIGLQLDICDDLEFWQSKTDYELDKYRNSYLGRYSDKLYNLRILLEDALQLKQWNYIKAAMLSYADDDKHIFKIFVKYGFLTDNVKLMKKYAQSSNHKIYELYQRGAGSEYNVFHKLVSGELSGVQLRQWKYMNDPEIHLVQTSRVKMVKKIKQVMKLGYFTFDDYYKLLSLALINMDLPFINYLSELGFPANNHPKRSLFDKLIKKYIGLSYVKDERIQDVKRFEYLVNIYTKLTNSRQELYDLIYQTYDINSIDDDIIKIIYGVNLDNISENTRAWVLDDLTYVKKNLNRIVRTFTSNISKISSDELPVYSKGGLLITL